jgi:hypothetical protein
VATTPVDGDPAALWAYWALGKAYKSALEAHKAGASGRWFQTN